jgi:hypothetical protein
MKDSFFDMLAKAFIVATCKLGNERGEQMLDRLCRQILASDFGQLFQIDVDKMELETKSSTMTDTLRRSGRVVNCCLKIIITFLLKLFKVLWSFSVIFDYLLFKYSWAGLPTAPHLPSICLSS